MARVIWADSAIHDLDAIADYIALENAAAARELVQRVLAAVERLQEFPRMGSRPNELTGLPYRQLIVSPCRIFYRVEKKVIYLVHILRGGQLVRRELFPTVPRASKSSGK
jgi:addiction module RelE/StbE family toxin